MYFKLALGNVKKSYKDYGIYFLTIALGVCIFYSFNSLESQKAIIEMKKSGAVYVDMLLDIISMVSVFISVILGSLILYANSFLIKKRKKELGIYKVLGMNKNKISKILVLETLIVGIVSLLIGIILGIIFSQVLSLFTVKLFDVSMNQYYFVLSIKAIGKTIFYFGIMFLLVMIFNTYLLSKYKIIDLLAADRKSENIKFRNPIIFLLIFIISILILVSAYKFVMSVGLRTDNLMFWLSIVLGIIGTILFFFSLSGFCLFILKSSKRIYFKQLNIFIIKQIYSKVNTNFISMAIICLMLFVTMVTLSTGISFKKSIESGLRESTPFDISAKLMLDETLPVTNVKQAFINAGFNFDNNEEYASYEEYNLPDMSVNDLISKGLDESSQNILNSSSIGNNSVNIIKISQYNDIRKLLNKHPIDLKDNEVIILSNVSDMIKVVNNYLENNNTITIKSKEYNVKNKEAITHPLKTDIMKNNIFTLVVNDNFTDKCQISSSNININIKNDKNGQLKNKYSNFLKDFTLGKYDYEKTGFILGATRESIYSESNGMTNTVLFVGIYLGIIFLIASMAVLALQQLSEASDSMNRYKALKKIGATDKMINKCIFTQTLTYFTLPVLLAFVHSIIGIKVVNNFIRMFNKPEIGITSLITAILFITIYIGYFYATYIGYKNIVESSN